MTHPEVATLYASIGPPQQVLLAERGNGDDRGVKSISDLNSGGRREREEAVKPVQRERTT